MKSNPIIILNITTGIMICNNQNATTHGLTLFPGLDFVHGTYFSFLKKERRSKKSEDVLDFFFIARE